jgi:hypothetical protein
MTVRENLQSVSNANSIARSWVIRLLVLLAALGVVAHAQGFVDAFAGRAEVTGLAGTLTGSNVGATIEVDEPRHGGKSPAKSMWITFVSPATGLMSLKVDGQDFDVLLGVYRVKAGQPALLRNLERVARSDDGDAGTSASVEFAVKAGERYEIAVDGFARSSGTFQMDWQVEDLGVAVPMLVATTPDQAFRPGDRVVITYSAEDLDDDDDDVKLHWFLNDVELENEEETTLVIPSLSEAQVGQYRVRVDTDDVRFFTEAVEVQMSTEGLSTTLARNKPEDSMESPLVGAGSLRPSPLRNAAPAGDGVSRGYNGSQIFNTVYAGRDPLEPVHCGQGSGSSYWFAYQAPESGKVVMDTVGSTFDTVLAAYTYDMPYAGYASLREIGCDDNSGPDGKASVVSFRVSPARYYVVVVDGVNGAKGRAHLNYRLETNAVPPLVAPRIQQPPADRVVAVGSPVTLEVVAEGSAPLAYRWFRPAAEPLVTTNGVLALGEVQLPQGGLYRVEISNAAGAVTSAPVGLTVWSDPVLELDGMSGVAWVRYGLQGPGSVPVEIASEVQGPWTPWTNGVPDATGIVRLSLDFATEPRRFLRLRLPAVSATSVSNTISQ